MAGLLVVCPTIARAQSRSAWIRPMAYGIPVYTSTTLAEPGQSAAELRLVQPMIMLRGGLLHDRLQFSGILNLEGLTIPGGELTRGDWGEGFVDRRHPHTYAHELMLWSDDLLGRRDGSARLSLAMGKGVVPFGTDDPMNRPFERYPVNHHLAQIIERAVAIGGARVGPIAIEGALFNGDEPTDPESWPRVSRFGDSWSVRLTLFPADGLELQGSRAVVESPEHRPGSGLDQSKWSASARWERSVGGHPVYGLLEWERTGEASGFNRFQSLLGEATWRTGRHRIGYRFERTDRPEEERTLSRWRSPRPPLDNSLLGVTRWTIHTAEYSVDLTSGEAAAELQPFVEVSYGKIRELRRGGFDPLDFYGQNAFWSVSLGMRLGWGGVFHRMGRYGVLASAAHQMMGRH